MDNLAKPSERRAALIFFPLIFVTILIVAFIFGYIWSLVTDGLISPVTVAQTTWINVVGVAFVCTAGMVLIAAKRRYRMYYGIVEVAFAMAAAWQAASKVSSAGTAEVLTVVAAIYFTVRGCENLLGAYEDKRLGTPLRVQRGPAGEAQIQV